METEVKTQTEEEIEKGHKLVEILKEFDAICRTHDYAMFDDFTAHQLYLVICGITDARTHDNFIELASRVKAFA